MLERGHQELAGPETAAVIVVLKGVHHEWMTWKIFSDTTGASINVVVPLHNAKCYEGFQKRVNLPIKFPLKILESFDALSKSILDKNFQKYRIGTFQKWAGERILELQGV